MHWGDDDVYFGELTAAELTPGGRGHGTFNVNSSTTTPQPPADDLFAKSNNNTETGELIRYVVKVFWGSMIRRTHGVLGYPDGALEFIARSSRTPRSTCTSVSRLLACCSISDHDNVGHLGRYLVLLTFTLRNH